MRIKKGELKSFNVTTYTATVCLAGSYKVFIEDVVVARNISSTEMTAGRTVAVVFFDENNPREAVVVAVYT